MLSRLQSNASQDNVEAIRQLDWEIVVLNHQEDLKWQQRAKQAWYNLRDKNTKYFHVCATQHRKANCISIIKDKNGHLLTGNEDIIAIFDDYFKIIFHSMNPLASSIQSCLKKVLHQVSNDMNDILLTPFTSQEVKKALDQMAPLKSPRPNDLSACFYQAYCNILGPEACSMILSFLNDGQFDLNINHTNLVLIPKKAHPLQPRDF